MIELLISVTIFMVIHVSTMALFMVAFTVKVKEISYGLGPTILSAGKFRVQPIPIGGYVKALDSREDEITENESQYALNHQSVGVQVFLPLSGCIVIFLISYIVLGESALMSFTSAFRDIVIGAVKPLSYGQEVIQRSREFIQQSSLITIIATAQLKFTALNLLPLSILNGGQAIISLVKMGASTTESWENITFQISLVLALGLFLSWLAALFYYVW